VVADIDQTRLDRAASILTVADAKLNGVELRYVNTKTGSPLQDLLAVSGGTGYDDVFVMAPVAPVVELGDAILGRDGCLNFFAGPTDPAFSAKFNFYNVHYGSTHIVGTSGGNTQDMRDALELMAAGRINPSMMITHIGGLSAAKEATLHLPDIPGGKKLIYTQVDFPLTAIADFGRLGATNPVFADLDRICAANNGLWCIAAERLVLEKMPRLALG
jgi:threonine dehydrogenase-like Zn-dependent dehydrogenase